MPQNTILINGKNYSWASVKLVLFGFPIVGILEINWNSKQKKENQYGRGVDPISRGYGNKEYEADITIYSDEWFKIINATSDKDPLNIPWFDVPVVFGESSLLNQVVTLKACEFLENPFTMKQGDTKITIKLPLIVGGIEYNQ